MWSCSLSRPSQRPVRPSRQRAHAVRVRSAIAKPPPVPKTGNGTGNGAGSETGNVALGEWTVERVTRHLSPAVSRPMEAIGERAKGSYIWTTDGRRFLDFSCGIGALSTGHCHPKVVKSLQDQAATLIMAQQSIVPASTPMVEVFKRFERIMPAHLPRWFFANSGSEVVDNALKIARSYTGRQNIIAFEGGFHGRTYGALSITTSNAVYGKTMGPLPPGRVVAPYPNCLHCKARKACGGMGYEVAPDMPPFGSYEQRGCCGGPLEALEMMLMQQSAPEDTAAIIVEPIMGEGGFLTPPPGFLPALRKLCDKHGILLIFDEVQCGAGRSGTWWAHQQLGGEEGVKPDMMLFAKGIGSGFPIGGIACRDDLYSKMTPGMMGGTYGGSALGMAAIKATIDVIEGEGLLDNAKERGLQLMQGLMELSKKYPIADVRGRGLMVGCEFGMKDGGAAAKGFAASVIKACNRRGMLILSVGPRETVRFLPPLNVSSSEMQQGLAIFEEALAEVCA